MHTMKRYEKRTRQERGLSLQWMLKTGKQSVSERSFRALALNARSAVGRVGESKLQAERLTTEEVLHQRGAGGAFSWWQGLSQTERAAVIEAARSKKRPG